MTSKVTELRNLENARRKRLFCSGGIITLPIEMNKAISKLSPEKKFHIYCVFEEIKEHESNVSIVHISAFELGLFSNSD